MVKTNQDNDLNDKKLTNHESIIINRNPTSSMEVSNKNYIDNELDKNTILRFNQILQNYLKVSVGIDTYNLTKYNKIQLIDLTEFRYTNIGEDLCEYRNKNLPTKDGSKVGNFLKSTTISSPTGQSRASSKPPIGIAFMYIETGARNHGHKSVFVSWERTDIIQITNITFLTFYNTFSILTNDSLKSMGRFRIQLLLEDKTWSTQYTIAKNTNYSIRQQNGVC